MIRLSAFADEAYTELDGQLELLNGLGLKWLEIRNVDGRNVSSISRSEAVSVRARLDDAGISVSAIASPIGKASVADPFTVQLDMLERVMDTAEILGTRNVRIFSFYAPDGIDVDSCGALVYERLAKMSDMAAARGLLLLHENEACIYGHSAANCAELCSGLFSPSFAQAYDPGNFVWAEKIVDSNVSCWPLLKPYVRHIHIKDWKLGSLHTGVLPGDGDGCVEQLVNDAVASSYDGFMTLEPHMSSGGQFGGTTSPLQFADALRRIKHYLDSNNAVYE